MSAEPILVALLSPLVSGRVYLDVAPSGALLPRIVMQQVGGEVINYTEGTIPDKENARMQVVCWGASRFAAANLAKQAEAAIKSSPLIQASAIGARISGYEQDTALYSSHQDFSIWTAR